MNGPWPRMARHGSDDGSMLGLREYQMFFSKMSSLGRSASFEYLYFIYIMLGLIHTLVLINNNCLCERLVVPA